MKSDTKKQESDDWRSVVSALEALREEMGRLQARVAAIESATVHPSPATPAAATQATAEHTADAKTVGPEPITEELVLILSAAIAAYLGVKPHIRQIRLLGSGAWAEHGRATIQASHVLSKIHG